MVRCWYVSSVSGLGVVSCSQRMRVWMNSSSSRCGWWYWWRWCRWPHSHYHSLHSHNPLLQLQLPCDCMLGMENIINSLRLCQPKQPTRCLCRMSIWTQENKHNSSNNNTNSAVFSVQRQSGGSREAATIRHNGGGGGSVLFSLMDCRLLREDTLWCGQEELWESMPRETQGERMDVIRSL